ncbi:MAG: SMC-Scp complex subunit ScpB [Burkholderiales bacterium]|nr:SMC-Scp complex subunit ScpB [Burkholderiales bacterium]
MTPNEIKRIIEALILCHDAPMPLGQIKEALAIEINHDTLRLLLDEIKAEWSERAVHLVQVATGYRFQTAPDVTPYIDRLRAEKPAQYSRAVLETLAIIAYRQPVTRGDIEDIRGVTVSSNIIKTLEERGWIDTVGHREVPGRPALLATTKQFLNDLGLLSLKELPALVGQADAETGQLELVQHPEDEDSIVDEQQLEQMAQTLEPLAEQVMAADGVAVHVTEEQAIHLDNAADASEQAKDSDTRPS